MDAETSPPQFKFRQELQGHSKDVRCVAETPVGGGGLVTGSRDGSGRLWRLAKGSGVFAEPVKFVQSEAFVSSLGVVAPNETFPEGLVVYGDQKGKVSAFSPADPTASVFSLDGHTGNVVAIAVDDDKGMIVSGSWDKTARIWAVGPDAKAVLEGHQAGVWDVAVLPGSQGRLPSVLTASADHTVCLWLEGQREKTFQGHSDCVRALGVLSPDRFLSAANDATVRLWSVQATACLRTFHGHENYIYSLSVLPGAESFVTGGEDRSVRVWGVEEETPRQTLLVPAQSVWCVAALKNGDVAAGSSDGLVRLFSSSSDRQGDGGAQMAYDESVATFASTVEKADEIGGIKIADMPGVEVLQAPGKRDGQQTMVRTGDGRVECHQWSQVEGKWTKLGDVVGDKKASEGKKMYLGKEYDYVFDVDIDEGAPKIKLPYNLDQDPWMVAQKWIHDNNLPQTYLDTVANFITTNAPGAGTGAVSQGGGDPLTGNRYIPGSGQTNGSNGTGGVDPLTGGGRYIPGSGGGGAAGGGADPLTGGGRYVPGSSNGGFVPVANLSKDPKRPVSGEMPLRDYVTFRSVSTKALMDKLIQFNSSEEVGAKEKLVVEDLDAFESILEGRTAPTEQVVKALENAVRWPTACLVPILDVLRVALLSPLPNEHFFGAEALGPAFVRHTLLPLLAEAQTGANVPLQILVCRCVANGVSLEAGQELLGKDSRLANEELVGAMAATLACPKAAAQTAAASALANLALALHCRKNGQATTERQAFVRALGKGLAGLGDVGSLAQPALLLLLQAIVTALYGDSPAINVAKGLRIDRLAVRAKDAYTGDEGKAVARAIEIMLQAEVELD